MTKFDFLKLMKFPEAWYEMYPDELYNIQIKYYEPGNENAPEHFRLGAFAWWLSINPSQEDIIKVRKLAEQEEEPGIRDQILGIINDIEIAKFEGTGFYLLMNTGMYSQLYKKISTGIKEKITEFQFSNFLSEIFNKLGRCKEIKLIDLKIKNIPTGNNSDMNLTYAISHEHANSIEKIFLDKENGEFRISGYRIQPDGNGLSFEM